MAAERLIAGCPWQSAGSPPPSAGNGSAMRAGPIGLMFYDRPQNLIRAAWDQGWITHQDPRCGAGSVAIAGAVALALQANLLEPRSFLAQLSQWVGQVDPSFAEWVDRLAQWLILAPETAAEIIAGAGVAADHERQWPGISPFVIPSVLWSLYSFLRSPDDYWETLCTSIAVGGDVDTTAAMAGAISGAYLGLGAIPDDLALVVNDRGTWGYAQLVALAERAYNLHEALAAQSGDRSQDGASEGRSEIP